MKLSEAMTTAAIRFRDPQMLDTTADRWRDLVQSARREFLAQVPSIVGHDVLVDIATAIGEPLVPLGGLTLVYGVFDIENSIRLAARTSMVDVQADFPEIFGSSRGRPLEYKVIGSDILFGPTPDAVYGFRVWGTQTAVDLASDGSADDDAFPEPAQYHDAYVEGALERRLIDDENPQRATYAHARFMDYVKLALSTEPSSREEDYPALVDNFYG